MGNALKVLQEYMGTGGVLILFLFAVIYLYLREKRKPRRILFVYVPILLLVLILNRRKYTTSISRSFSGCCGRWTWCISACSGCCL